ncbi:MAG TPA: CPBP family intramembrane glutamic endopeptidase [Myxococcales bacterium]|nr:CPBP family intramembrane glutamic endopeptidase [Myxococcales bacterium]
MIRSPVREALTVWAAVMGVLAAVRIVGLALPALHQVVGALAVAAFLYAPVKLLERRGQDAHDAGWRFDRIGADAGWALLACAAILPPFTLGFWWFVRELPRLPPHLAALLAPYVGAAHPLRFRLGPQPWDLAGRIAGNAAVAFSEEFFYRGYVTLRLEERWPPSMRILGAPVGRAAVLAAALFAAGHLLEPAPWRLAVFFPALVFAWLRARTGTIVGAAICHFVFNVWLLLLERAAFG